MGTPLKTYDLLSVYIIVGGQRLTGFVEDDAISFEYAADIGEHAAGADGQVTFSRSNDKRVIATISLAETSLAYKQLGAQLQEQEAETTIQRRDFLMRDDISGDKISDEFATFITRPSLDKGRTFGAREFQILLPNGAEGLKFGANLSQ